MNIPWTPEPGDSKPTLFGLFDDPSFADSSTIGLPPFAFHAPAAFTSLQVDDSPFWAVPAPLQPVPYPSPILDSPPISITHQLHPMKSPPRAPTPGTALAASTRRLALSPKSSKKALALSQKALAPAVFGPKKEESPDLEPDVPERFVVGSPVMTLFPRFGAWPTIVRRLSLDCPFFLLFSFFWVES